MHSQIPFRLIAQDAVPGLLGILVERRPRPLDAGVVVGTIEPTVGADRAADKRRDLGRDRHVGADDQRLPVGSLDRLNCCVAARGIHIGNDDPCAGVSGRQRGRAADARRPAGDEHDLAFQSVH